MTINHRFPTSYTIFAGLAGAIAWGLPYLISPFVPFIPWMPNFPVYESPIIKVHLAEFSISYSLAGIIAGGLFLAGLRFFPINPERFSRPAVSLSMGFSLLAGLAVGGAFAFFFGVVVGYSQAGYSLAIQAGFFNNLPEPYFSIGLSIGYALATILVCAFSGILKQVGSAADSPIQLMFKLVLQVSARLLIIRAAAYLLEYSILATSNSVKYLLIFILFQAASGALFGAWTWTFCSKLKPA